MKHIAVFCSAKDVDEKYKKAAGALAQLIAANDYHLVWGGSDEGLMKIVASEVQSGGRQIVGVSMELLKDVARKNANEMIFAKDHSERKAIMLKRSDAVIVLVGGIGTLDEISEILEFKKHGMHNKPIVILNTDNFYEGLQMLLTRMKNDNFISKPVEEYVYFAQQPQEAINYINKKLHK